MNSPSSLEGYVIAVDPGHGDRDQGTQGRHTGVFEATLNMQVAAALQKQLQDAGVIVVMTRVDDTVIYAQGEGTYKQRDMRQRAATVNENDSDLLISIHMNFFDDGQYGGAQTFYQNGSEKGAKLAQDIQTAIVTSLQGDNTRKPQSGDFYMLRETKCTAVLVECGFLSNATDEANLQEAQYQDKMAQCIVEGVHTYLGIS
ncbi:MAG: N-acetylmuramoyl-L-alanine amidase [Eubacteriales bacterium]|nr:N-acetylmuramoyl-L-alanine amidase [Eubacteriales bacterium]